MTRAYNIFGRTDPQMTLCPAFMLTSESRVERFPTPTSSYLINIFAIEKRGRYIELPISSDMAGALPRPASAPASLGPTLTGVRSPGLGPGYSLEEGTVGPPPGPGGPLRSVCCRPGLQGRPGVGRELGCGDDGVAGMWGVAGVRVRRLGTRRALGPKRPPLKYHICSLERNPDPSGSPAQPLQPPLALSRHPAALFVLIYRRPLFTWFIPCASIPLVTNLPQFSSADDPNDIQLLSTCEHVHSALERLSLLGSLTGFLVNSVLNIVPSLSVSGLPTGCSSFAEKVISHI